jgi:hypothetical protein
MVELLSYWKLACPALIEIAAAPLSDEEIIFWEDLIRHGMGEYFYVNSILPSLQFSIVARTPTSDCARSTEPTREPRVPPPNPESMMVLVGGGKDSIVTLELLKRDHPSQTNTLHSFVLNPIPASLEAIAAAGYPAPLQAKRSLDPQLFELNAQGYLNGHTPFSALLCFVSTLVAYQNSIGLVLASNESSASEGNVSYGGVEINHQYSKSFRFEERFRQYLQQSQIPVRYLSFLRPLNELQICALFSRFTDQHPIFRSCNREQTRKARQRDPQTVENPAQRAGWCAECPKCVFTYLCLSCFLSQSEITTIFGINPSTTHSFLALVRELAGLTEHKPFECVGTFEEVRACVLHLFKNGSLDALPSDQRCVVQQELAPLQQRSVSEILTTWNNQHFLDDALSARLREALNHAREGLRS